MRCTWLHPSAPTAVKPGCLDSQQGNSKPIPILLPWKTSLICADSQISTKQFSVLETFHLPDPQKLSAQLLCNDIFCLIIYAFYIKLKSLENPKISGTIFSQPARVLCSICKCYFSISNSLFFHFSSHFASTHPLASN